MAGKKRSKYEKSRDRQVLVKLWALQCYTQEEMTDRLQEITGASYKLSQQQISYDLKLIEKKLDELTAKELGQAKAEEIAKLDALELEYTRGYKLSIGQKEKSRRKIGKTSDGDNKEYEVQKEELIGNPKWLDGIGKVISQRIKIRGLEAPKDINMTNIDLTQLNERQLERIANGENALVVLATPGESDS